jgi:hypothetical protein
LDAIDHAFFTPSLSLVQPDYLREACHPTQLRSKITAWLEQARDAGQHCTPREHASDAALPWFCREGLPSDHLPLEFAFNFQKPEGV